MTFLGLPAAQIDDQISPGEIAAERLLALQHRVIGVDD